MRQIGNILLIIFLLLIPLSEALAIANPVVPNAKLGEFRHGTYPSLGDRTHPGVDLVADCGDPIYAFADGEVIDAIEKLNDRNFNSLGYMVMLKHPASLTGKAFYTQYLHLRSPPSVGVGEAVVGGSTLLGRVGDTGVAYGCHTHFEIRYFASRFSAWGNIYGEGDQRNTDYFQHNWEDPLSFLEKYRRGLTKHKASPKTVTPPKSENDTCGWRIPIFA